MNIVKAGSRYQVYGEDVETFKRLPVRTYSVGFHPQMGFWLNSHNDLDAKEDIIYGSHVKRVDKIMKSFQTANRNFGVILSGKKGIGKSLLARMIAARAHEMGLPVIVANKDYPGLSDFLSEIEQEVVIIFDEFEKVFRKKDSRDPQSEMLSLFDGIDSGKKLFIITCNNVNQLNEFLVNRPGRFHYHFEIGCPMGDEVRKYMNDKLGEGFKIEVEKVVKLASMTDMTYDNLRAITFDLRQGYHLEETLQDLNINYEEDAYFDMTIRLSNGWIIPVYSKNIDIYSDRYELIRCYFDRNEYDVEFNPSDLQAEDGGLYIGPGKAIIRCHWGNFNNEMDDNAAEIKRREFDKTVTVESITFGKVMRSAVYKYKDV